jgi:hypothetical protein
MSILVCEVLGIVEVSLYRLDIHVNSIKRTEGERVCVTSQSDPKTNAHENMILNSRSESR